MEERNLSKLLKLVQLLQVETEKYAEGKSTERKIIKILGKISTIFDPLEKGNKVVWNHNKIKENMELISKFLIIAYEVLKHFMEH